MPPASRKPCRCNAARRVPKRPWVRRVLESPLCVCASTGTFLRFLYCSYMEFRGPGCVFQAKLDAVNKNSFTPLYLAAMCGHAAVVSKLLQANVAVDAADANGQMPLHLAAGNGHAAVAELLPPANASHTAVTITARHPRTSQRRAGTTSWRSGCWSASIALLRSKCRWR